MVFAVIVAVLPALVALGLWPVSAGRLAAGLGSLVAVVGGVKLASVAWAADASVH